MSEAVSKRDSYAVRPERILIVGGGIAGLTAAIAMRARGFEPELVERAPAWRTIGLGITLQPNAMRLLRELGVGTQIEEPAPLCSGSDISLARGARSPKSTSLNCGGAATAGSPSSAARFKTRS